MNDLVLMPTMARKRFDFSDAEIVEPIVEVPKVAQNVSFLDANTNAITMEELTNSCVVPTWGNQELTISHQDFVSCVYDAAKDYYHGESFGTPELRVSHIVRGRIPSALGKRASELLESEKTQFYQRMAFAFTIPSLFETLQGEKLELCVGGCRNYSDLNLYRQTKGAEKFSIFVGWRMKICSNQILSGNGVKLSFEVMSLRDLYKITMDLFSSFVPAKDIYLMQTLSNTYLSESRFAQIIGRFRMYQALPNNVQRGIPKLLITDSQINSVCREFYHNETFGVKDNQISMFDFHNLLTQSNKSSYIDSYISRAVNATEVATGINNALHGDEKYSWFIG